MIFTEFRFLFFFAVVFCVHWALRNLTARKVWLLLASYTFYGLWDWRFLSLIWFSTVVDWIAGHRIHAATDPIARRRWRARRTRCRRWQVFASSISRWAGPGRWRRACSPISVPR